MAREVKLNYMIDDIEVKKVESYSFMTMYLSLDKKTLFFEVNGKIVQTVTSENEEVLTVWDEEF